MSGFKRRDTREDLEKSLKAHGHQFLSLFDSSALTDKRSTSPQPLRKKKRVSESSDEFEEWTGFGGPRSSQGGYTHPYIEDNEQSDKDHDHLARHQACEPDVVVFNDTVHASSGSSTSKAQMKAFMSSKVSNLRKIVEDMEQDGTDAVENENELTNLQNDALLHRLVHTKLLSGALNPDIGTKSSVRRKALAGRVLEVAGQAKLGRGESSVRKAEHNKASKRVRDGLLAKQEERSKKMLADAKDVGNYHPALKQLYVGPTQSDKKKRARGLRMGVGSFHAGVLKLGRTDLDPMRRAEGRGSLKQGRGRGIGGRHRRG